MLQLTLQTNNKEATGCNKVPVMQEGQCQLIIIKKGFQGLLESKYISHTVYVSANLKQLLLFDIQSESAPEENALNFRLACSSVNRSQKCSQSQTFITSYTHHNTISPKLIQDCLLIGDRLQSFKIFYSTRVFFILLKKKNSENFFS